MKTVFNPGARKAGRIRFQCAGRAFQILPVGESQWDDDTAQFLQRKYVGQGIRIVPSAEEVEATNRKQAVLTALRTAPTIRSRRAALEARGALDKLQTPADSAAVLIEQLQAVEASIEAEAVPEPEAPAEEQAQPEAPADGQGDVS